MHDEHESLGEVCANLEGAKRDIRQYHQDFLDLISTTNSNVEVRQVKKGIPHLNLTITDGSAVMIQYLKSKEWGGGPLWKVASGSSLYTILKDEFETFWNMNSNS